MALGIMGFYLTLFGVWKIKASFAKPAPKVEHHVAATVGGGIPSPDSEEFGPWLGIPGNFERLFTEA